MPGYPLLRFVLPFLLLACESAEPSVEVFVSPNAAAVELWSADELARLLSEALAERVEVRNAIEAPECRPNSSKLWVQAAETTIGDAQQFSVTETRCGSGRVVRMRGGAPQSTAWAVHEVMERLGFRFFHPEQTFVPQSIVWPLDTLATEQAPGFRWRGMAAHMTHPIELSPPMNASPEQSRLHWTRWLDWNVRMRQTGAQELSLRDDVGETLEPAGYRAARGFGSRFGLALLETQQGHGLVIDPDDPRSEADQIDSAIAALAASAPADAPIQDVTFTFNSTEFSVEPEDLTLARIEATQRAIRTRLPEANMWTINHGTAQVPGPSGARFFDLSQFSNPAVGVQVHPLMLYDVHRGAAGAYGNESFSHLYEWMQTQKDIRRITYFPESSWWLTFDLPVPLFLAPATIEARGYDIERLRDSLSTRDSDSTGIYGHLLFTSGQEWGYWMIDYCVAKMSWSPQMSWQQCLDHVTDVFARGDEISTLLQQIAERQAIDMRDPNLVRMLVGVDQETRSAAEAGIVFHPLPPTMVELLTWNEDQVTSFTERSLTPLLAMGDDYGRWLTALNEIVMAQDDRQAPWVREIRDGVQIMQLRAQHQYECYQAVLAMRRALASGDEAEFRAAMSAQSRAVSTTQQARSVIVRRELDYRYSAELSTAGDEVGTPGAIANRTVYPYRVLSRTHRLFYWERPDAELRDLLAGGFDAVTVNQRILTTDEPLVVRTQTPPLVTANLSWGDGVSTQDVLTSYSHLYGAQGLRSWSLVATHASGAVSHEDQVCVAERRILFGKGTLRIQEPQGAGIVESALPGFALGIGEDELGEFLVVGRIDDGSGIPRRGSLLRRTRIDSSSGPSDLPIQLANFGSLTVHEATISWRDGSDTTHREITIDGTLVTQELVDLLVTSGAFEAAGARALIASTLGYTPNTLPADVDFVIVSQAGVEAPF